MFQVIRFVQKGGLAVIVTTKGFFWHVHHTVLIEWCYDYNERAQYIRTEKPKDEQGIRLRLFQPVKGNLPQEVIEARQAEYSAGQACDKAWQAYDEACRVCNSVGEIKKTRFAYLEAQRVPVKAGQAYFEALDKHMPAIQALHEAECPDCPWNGHTIFP
jgi:hypothetical protein